MTKISNQAYCQSAGTCVSVAHAADSTHQRVRPAQELRLGEWRSLTAEGSTPAEITPQALDIFKKHLYFEGF